MDTSHIYMFIDYDGVVKTYAEWLPNYNRRQIAPFSHSMIRILSYFAWRANLPAYFIPISSTPGSYNKAELKTMFEQEYGVYNLELHPQEPIVPVRLNRQDYVKNILQKYDVQYHLILDDEFLWYEHENLNYFRTDTYEGIKHDTFCKICNWIETINPLTE